MSDDTTSPGIASAKPTTPGGRVEAVFEGYRGSGTAKLILLAIAVHDGAGGSWPSIDLLARYASVTRRNAQKAIDRLVAEGVLRVEPNRGGTLNTRVDRRTNLYLIDYEAGCRQRHVATTNGVSPPTPRGVATDARGVSLPTPEQGKEQEVEQDTPATLPLSVPATPPRTRPREDHDLAFGAFWTIYPRHVGKRDARRAWERAIRRARPEVIIGGAQRYRDDPHRVDAYTAHPATWLNRDGWDDDPEPARVNGNGSAPPAAAGYTGRGHSWA